MDLEAAKLASAVGKASSGVSSGQVRKSCDICSKAKKKCNGEFPCSSCVRWKTQCSYSMKLKPGPNASGRSQSGNYMPKKQRVHDPLPLRVSLDGQQSQYVDIHPEELLANKPEIPFGIPLFSSQGSTTPGQKELFHIQLHYRLTSCTYPLCPPKFLSVGYRNMFLPGRSLSPEKNIFVALAWCAAALGASSIHDPSALEYCRCARESLRLVLFDNSSDFLSRAFFALEVACHITIIQKALVEDGDPTAPPSFGFYTTFYSPGQYLGFGRAVLSQVPRHFVQGETLIMLWHAFMLNNVFNKTYFEQRELPEIPPLQDIDRFPLTPIVETPKPGEEKLVQYTNALVVCYYCNIVSLDWIKRIFPFANDNSSSSGSSSRSSNRAIPALTSEEHLRQLATDLRYMTTLESHLEPEVHPIPYILLQFSILLHKLRLAEGSCREPLSGMVNLASFICKRPLVIFSPQLWHCVHILVALLFRFNLEESQALCEYLGRVLVRTMHRLKRTHQPWARYTQITLSMSLQRFSAIAGTSQDLLKQLIYSRCPLLFAMSPPTPSSVKTQRVDPSQEPFSGDWKKESGASPFEDSASSRTGSTRDSMAYASEATMCLPVNTGKRTSEPMEEEVTESFEDSVSASSEDGPDSRSSSFSHFGVLSSLADLATRYSSIPRDPRLEASADASFAAAISSSGIPFGHELSSPGFMSPSSVYSNIATSSSLLLSASLPPIVLLNFITLPQIARILRFNQIGTYFENVLRVSLPNVTGAGNGNSVGWGNPITEDVVVIYHTEELPYASSNGPYMSMGEQTVVLHLFRPAA